jgi:ketosteroid isomerase-like protein
MNKVLAVFFFLMLVCIVATNTFGQTASSSATHAERLGATEDVQQVLAVDEARRLAMLHSDVSALDSLLAEDATIFWGDGTADDKASTLALLRSGRLRYAQLDYENTRVRLYGETAVVTGQARVKEQSDKERRSYVVRVTRVYVRQEGRWRQVASQTTRVAPIPWCSRSGD